MTKFQQGKGELHYLFTILASYLGFGDKYMGLLVNRLMKDACWKLPVSQLLVGSAGLGGDGDGAYFTKNLTISGCSVCTRFKGFFPLPFLLILCSEAKICLLPDLPFAPEVVGEPFRCPTEKLFGL